MTRGYYIAPTVFSNVDDSNTIAKDEIFGPVQSVLKWSDVEDVLVSRPHSNRAIGFGSPILAWLFSRMSNASFASDQSDWSYKTLDG